MKKPEGFIGKDVVLAEQGEVEPMRSMFLVKGIRSAGEPLIPADSPVFDVTDGSPGTLAGAVTTGGFSFTFGAPLVMCRVKGLSEERSYEVEVGPDRFVADRLKVPIYDPTNKRMRE